MQTDISKMPVTELKALAFDFLVEAERLQKNLQIINQEIAKRQATTTNVPETEVKTD